MIYNTGYWSSDCTVHYYSKELGLWICDFLKEQKIYNYCNFNFFDVLITRIF